MSSPVAFARERTAWEGRFTTLSTGSARPAADVMNPTLLGSVNALDRFDAGLHFQPGSRLVVVQGPASRLDAGLHFQPSSRLVVVQGPASRFDAGLYFQPGSRLVVIEPNGAAFHAGLYFQPGRRLIVVPLEAASFDVGLDLHDSVPFEGKMVVPFVDSSPRRLSSGSYLGNAQPSADSLTPFWNFLKLAAGQIHQPPGARGCLTCG